MIPATGISSSRNPLPSTSLTGRILAVALGMLSGFQGIFAGQATQIPGPPGAQFAVASAGEQAVTLWLNTGQLYGAVVHPSSAVNSRIIHKSNNVLSSFAIDCWDKGCLAALNICRLGKSISTAALTLGINGSNLMVGAEYRLAQQLVQCSSGGHLAVRCSHIECSVVWNTGGVGSTQLRRAVYNLINSTYREVDNGGIGWVRDPAGLSYAGSEFFSLSTYRVANHVIVHRWSDQGMLLTSLLLKNISESLDPRGSALGCFDSGKCLSVWLVNRGEWNLTARFFDSNGTLLDWIEFMGIGPDLSIPQFDSLRGLGILGQSNATHLMYSWISPDGDQSTPFFLLAASDPSAAHAPFAIRRQSEGAILVFWSALENSNMMHWIEAPRMSTSSATTLVPLPTSLSTTQTMTLGGSAGQALENRTVAAMMPSEGVTVAPSHQSSASRSLGATIGAIVGVAGSFLCIAGAILGIRRLRRFRSSEDIGADGTQLEQSEANQADDESQSKYPCTVSSSANDGAEGQHYNQLPAAQESQYASIARVSAPDYEQLELRPDGKDHYEALEPLNRAHDEYMSARMQQDNDGRPQH